MSSENINTGETTPKRRKYGLVQIGASRTGINDGASLADFEKMIDGIAERNIESARSLGESA